MFTWLGELGCSLRAATFCVPYSQSVSQHSVPGMSTSTVLLLYKYCSVLQLVLQVLYCLYYYVTELNGLQLVVLLLFTALL